MDLFYELSDMLWPLIILIVISGGVGGLIWDAASKKKK